MKYAPVLFLLLAASALAQRAPLTVQRYMREYGEVWNSGKVCRHAVGRLSKLAQEEGREFGAPIFDTTHPIFNHTLFVLEFEGRWFAIDARKEGGSEYLPYFLELPRYDPEGDFEEYRRLSGRPLTKFVKEAPSSTLRSWQEQTDWTVKDLDFYDSVLMELDKNARLVRKGEAILKAHGGEVWETYQAYLKAHEEGTCPNEHRHESRISRLFEQISGP